MKSIYVLGINSVYHESSAAILKNGELVAFVEEERYNRIKHAKPTTLLNTDKLPWNSINYCLEAAKINLKDVDYFAYSFDPSELLKENIGQTSKKKTKSVDWMGRKRRAIFYRKIVSTPQAIGEVMGREIKNKFVFAPHHLSHAAGCYYPSGFKDAAILVADGTAEYASTWMGKGAGRQIERLAEIYYPNSLGFLWEKFSMYLGFSKYDASKVMGLSSYGNPGKFRNQFNKIIQIRPDGRFEIDNKYMDFESEEVEQLEKLFKLKRRDPTAPILPAHENVAAELQEITEEVLVKLARHLHRQTRLDNLCLSGGVALNCVANTKIFKECGFNNIYVQPAAHDAGTALGAALYIWHVVLQRKTYKPLEHAYWGPAFSNREIEQALVKNRLAFKKIEKIEKTVATLLSHGSIVAWFQGRMESGPRALGNRSILADPRNPKAREELNRKVKFREAFRPFCPSVLAEEAQKWFELGKGKISPIEYMLMAVDVIKNKRRFILAVVHVDNTSRIQAVRKEINPKYYNLIKEFERITGIPLVLNTSFNIQEPIVCKPEHAIKTFKKSQIDYLAIGDYLVNHEKVNSNSYFH